MSDVKYTEMNNGTYKYVPKEKTLCADCAKMYEEKIAAIKAQVEEMRDALEAAGRFMADIGRERPREVFEKIMRALYHGEARRR